MSMTHKQTADRLRVAMAYIKDISGNENYYDDEHDLSYSIVETLQHLDGDFPVFTTMEQQFIDVVASATGFDIAHIDKFVLVMRDEKYGGDYMEIPNGTSLRDHWETFNGAYALGKKGVRK